MTRWPALLGPYSKNYQTLADDGTLSTISDTIKTNPDYQTLADSDARLQELGIEQLTLDKQATNLHKLLYLRRLASLNQQLNESGSPTDIATYNSFVQCESMPINSKSNARNVAEQNAND